MDLEWVWDALAWLQSFGVEFWNDHRRDLLYALVVASWGAVRLAGCTVESGSTGLKFSFGRAVRVCEPGFYPLVPILQTIRVVPSRSRTLELPRQSLSTVDELVYEVDASLVYRVVDVRKALVDVDDYEKAMPEILALGVHEVLGSLRGAELHVSSELDSKLARSLARRLQPWGIVVERAGFATMTPDVRTTRVTQLAARTRARERAIELFADAGLSRGRALALLGRTSRFVTRSHVQRTRAIVGGVARRHRALVERLSSASRSATAVAATPAADE